MELVNQKCSICNALFSTEKKICPICGSKVDLNSANTKSVHYSWESDNDTRAKLMLKRPGSAGKLKRLKNGQKLFLTDSEINFNGEIFQLNDIEDFHIFNRLAWGSITNIIEINFKSRKESLYIAKKGILDRNIDNLSIQQLFTKIAFKIGQKEKEKELEPYKEYIDPRLEGFHNLLIFFGILPYYAYLYNILSKTEPYAKRRVYQIMIIWVILVVLLLILTPMAHKP